MKINLPVFKDEDSKDAVTYQSWRWDLTVYWHAGCRDHTLLPYVIRSLQGYTGELVWSSGMEVTLDDVLTILDEHYNNVKALDVLNQELFQLWMADKESVLDLGICLSRHLQVLAASFPDHFPPDHMAEMKRDHFYGRLPKWLKVMVAYLKVGTQVRTYSDYLRAIREAEKEDLIELPQSSRTQTADAPPNQGLLASSPWANLRATSHFQKASCPLGTFGGRGCGWWQRPREWWSWWNWGVTKEFMVQLAKAVKDTQADEKHCYHCSSPEHFICNCPLVKTSRDKKQLNGKEGMASMKGAWTPLATISTMKSPQMEAPKA